MAKDQKTGEAVYACAEKIFIGHRPFYWTASSAGWYSPGNGRLYHVSAERLGRARVRLAYDDARESPPLRVGGLVRSPRWKEGQRAIASAGSGGIRGIVIVEALISTEGVVEATRVLKPLPAESTAAAEELVRRMRFHPATLLGRPVPVFWNVTVPVGTAPMVTAGETIPRRHPL